MRRRSLLPVLAAFLLSACFGAQAPAPVSRYGSTAGEGSVGVHTVAPGDTLYSLSERYRLPMRDIISLNRMSPPFMLAPGQRLKLPPPNTYKVKAGDSLSEISRLFGVSSSETARLNNLRAPYRVAAGETLRLPTLHTGDADRGRPVQFVNALPPEPLPKPSHAKPPPARYAPVSRTGDYQPPAYLFSSAQKPVPQLAVKPDSYPKAAVTAAAPPRAGGGFLWPVQGRILSSYGAKKDGLHNDGINIAVPKGTPVRAAENGVVVYADDELQGYGNLVLIRHADKWMTAYAHMDRTLTRRGAQVRRGETIGTVGSSGSAETPQLHFEIRKGSEPLDPQSYLN